MHLLNVLARTPGPTPAYPHLCHLGHSALTICTHRLVPPVQITAVDTRMSAGSIAPSETASVTIEYLPLSLGMCSTAPMLLVDTWNQRNYPVNTTLAMLCEPH